MITLLIALAVLGLFFGGWGHHAHREDWGYGGWFPLGFIVLLALVLYVGGYLH